MTKAIVVRSLGGPEVLKLEDVPLGAPVFLATTRPNSAQPLRRLMLAQDTGGAIRGVVRADFFWGFGADAGSQAGKMKQSGQMWVILPPLLRDVQSAFVLSISD